MSDDETPSPPCGLDHPLWMQFRITSTSDSELDGIQWLLRIRENMDDDVVFLRVLDFVGDRVEREHKS